MPFACQIPALPLPLRAWLDSMREKAAQHLVHAAHCHKPSEATGSFSL